MKGIIVDDEVKSRFMLQTLCDTYCEGLEINGLAASVLEAISMIDLGKPDIVFLDIRMPIKSGFALLEHYQEQVPFEVIFTTAYDQYALKAFKFAAIDYLLKPISLEALITAVNKVRKIRGSHKRSERINHLKAAISQRKIEKIALTTLDGFTFTNIDEIVRCEAEGNYTSVFLSDGSSLLITKTLKHYEETLVNYPFFRTHKSHLINLNYVRRFVKGKQGMVEMTDGKMIEISQRKKDLLLTELNGLTNKANF